ncbi:hypothetical protein Hanom_Chr11g01061961 [Helianthus anomalus]
MESGVCLVYIPLCGIDQTVILCEILCTLLTLIIVCVFCLAATVCDVIHLPRKEYSVYS